MPPKRKRKGEEDGGSGSAGSAAGSGAGAGATPMKDNDDDDKEKTLSKQERQRAAFEAYQRDQKAKLEEREKADAERLNREIERKWGKAGISTTDNPTQFGQDDEGNATFVDYSKEAEDDENDLFGAESPTPLDADDEDEESHSDKKQKLEHMLSPVEAAANFENQKYLKNLEDNKLSIPKTEDVDELIQMILMYTNLSMVDTLRTVSYNEGFERKIELKGLGIMFQDVPRDWSVDIQYRQIRVKSVDLQTSTVKFNIARLVYRHWIQVTMSTSPNSTDWQVQMKQNKIKEHFRDVIDLRPGMLTLFHPSHEGEFIQFLDFEKKKSFSIPIADRGSAIPGNQGLSLDHQFVWLRYNGRFSSPSPATMYLQIFKRDATKLCEIIEFSRSPGQHTVRGFTPDNRYFVTERRPTDRGPESKDTHVDILLYDTLSGQLMHTYKYDTNLPAMGYYLGSFDCILTSTGIWFAFNNGNTFSSVQFLEFPTKGNIVKESEPLLLRDRADYSRLYLLEDSSLCVLRRLYHTGSDIITFHLINPKITRSTKAHR